MECESLAPELGKEQLICMPTLQGLEDIQSVRTSEEPTFTPNLQETVKEFDKLFPPPPVVEEEKSCCPLGQMNSHSDAECPAASSKQTIRRKNLDAEDSKQGKGAVRKRKSFKRFKHDLEQVVIKGRCPDGLQYILETTNNASLYAYYLLSVFGDYFGPHHVESHGMGDNLEIMDLWAKYSIKGMSKISAEKYLLKAFQQV